MSKSESGMQQVWSAISVSQVAELCKKAVPGKMEISRGDTAFSITRDDGGEGIISVRGLLSADVIAISIEVLRAPGHIKMPLAVIVSELTKLGDMVKLIPPPADSSDSSLWVGLGVKAGPLSYIRSSTLTEELDRIDKLAKGLQAHLPSHVKDNNLEKKYASFKDSLTPVYPWKAEKNRDIENLCRWAEHVYDVLLGSASVAVSSPHVAALDLAASVLAEAMQGSGSSLGLVTTPTVKTNNLIEVATGAPGYVIVPVHSLSLGTNIYEMEKEIRSLLAALTDIDKPVVFTGTYAQLQSLFHGGQGGESDPLTPVICRVPDVSLETLTRFSVGWAGRRVGGISSSAERSLSAELFDALQGLSPSDRERVLPAVARRIVKDWTSGRSKGNISAYAMKMSSLSETLSGLSIAPRALRSAGVQERFIRVLNDPELLPFLKSRLLGQDQALEQLVVRLSTECLTRPLHQPLCYCAQGMPGTGKSESVALLADRLGVPLVHIDAASIPDYYTGAAQLLGSGRGIVGSYQSGRLEQAAKHHAGVVIEVSDLDHANPGARAALADLFLQVLEVGEATSAVGATFSCANVIFAFTMNLPNGMDETVHRGIGFANTPTRSDVAGKVSSEIKKMLSTAFLSRIGTPIIFDPLSGEALGRIIERAIEEAIPTAAVRLGRPVKEVVVLPGTGMKLMASLDSALISSGARLLIQQGRIRSGEALKALCRSGGLLDGKTLIVSYNSDGLVITATEGGKS
jgi:hypothetical protein